MIEDEAALLSDIRFALRGLNPWPPKRSSVRPSEEYARKVVEQLKLCGWQIRPSMPKAPKRVALCGRAPVLLYHPLLGALPTIDEDGQQYIRNAKAEDDKQIRQMIRHGPDLITRLQFWAFEQLDRHTPRELSRCPFRTDYKTVMG